MPSSSTNPSDTTTPGSSTNPSDTTAPDGSTNPNATTNPNASTTPNGTTAPGGETTTNPVLPNTGQMNWPIPTFAGAGLMFLLIGFLLKYSRKEEADET